MNKSDLEKIIKKTIEDNKGPFCSEADFQLALAMKLKSNNKYDVKCEYTPNFDRGIHTDIVIFDCDNRKAIPIELKYKTKKDAVGNIIFKNKSLSAQWC